MHLAVYVPLLAHERAHASSLHYLFTTVARLAAAATGDRQLAARAIAHAALAATALEAARDLHALLAAARAAGAS